jgi:hypothetical protein
VRFNKADSTSGFYGGGRRGGGDVTRENPCLTCVTELITGGYVHILLYTTAACEKILMAGYEMTDELHR